MKYLFIILLIFCSLNLKSQQINLVYQLKPIDENNPFSKYKNQDYYLYIHEIKNGYVLFEVLPNKNSSITFNKIWFSSCTKKLFNKLYVKTEI